MQPIQRALVSVSDKTGLVDFARGLSAFNIEILSTGGSATLLRAAGLHVQDVSEYTGFPEIMHGRVKTLHPRIHGALLGRRGTDDAVMLEHHIKPIDLLVVNLYPFDTTVAKPDCSPETAIDNIDVGGPALLRAAAKNHTRVAVIADTADYGGILDELHANQGALTDDTRYALAAKAFAHTAAYDGAIANYLSARKPDGTPNGFPNIYSAQFHKLHDLRYGENPHQRAAFYAERHPAPGSMAKAILLQGKPLSFNNIADADAALRCVQTLDQGACVIVKHANPCGAALGPTLTESYLRAYQTDPASAFGGVVSFNQELDGAAACEVLETQFVEVIVAPKITADARTALSGKPNVRVLVTGASRPPFARELDYHRVSGGMLLQDADLENISATAFKTVTRKIPSAQQLSDLLFAWRLVKFVKSNAVVCVRAGATVGIGAGQPSRIMSARIAIMKAGEAGLPVAGSVMASDAFFPFRDSVDAAAGAGITAIVQPGGSLRDPEVITAADAQGIAMVFTGTRHFRH